MSRAGQFVDIRVLDLLIHHATSGTRSKASLTSYLTKIAVSSGLDSRRCQEGDRVGYFPMQNVEKMRLRMSSAVVAPVTASMGRRAA